MNSGYSLLMTNTSPIICNQCTEVLENLGLSVTICECDGVQAYRKIEEMAPTAVLLDVFMPFMDAFTLKEEYCNNYPNSIIQFYAMASFRNDELERELIENGFLFYFLKPFDPQALAKRILLAAENNILQNKTDAYDVESIVSKLLASFGIPPHIKGYRFIKDAVVLAVETPDIMNSITKHLYPAVAQKNGTQPTRVERAIRHAIEIAWDRGDIDVLNYYFGSTISPMRGKPTNSEFIATLSEKIYIETIRRA